MVNNCVVVDTKLCQKEAKFEVLPLSKCNVCMGNGGKEGKLYPKKRFLNTQQYTASIVCYVTSYA